MTPPEDIEVWLDDEPVGPVRVGTLRPSFQGGRSLASTSFQYDAAFLGSANRYQISPDLPLASSRQYAPENRALFGAFADAAPDEWGRKIIEANHAQQLKSHPELPRKIGDFDFLLGVSDHTRMGALRLRRSGSDAWLSTDDGVANIHDLDRILQATQRYEANQATDADVAYLNDVATSPGGARPKANVALDGDSLAIAKLPHSKDGNIDVEMWEALALTMARNCGITVSAWKLENGGSKAVLVVSRFDRSHGHRKGYLSAASAMEVSAYDDRRVTYEEFADTIAELSHKPSLDLHEMFARIALTVLINNVDDHWRNHGFLHGREGWRLAPAFDINPSPRRGSVNSRAISSDDDPRDRDIRNLEKVASHFQLPADEARATIRRVGDEVNGWAKRALQLGIPEEQLAMMSPAFAQDQIDYARSL